MKIVYILLIAISCHCGCFARTIIFLQPNTTQLFSELYQAYGLLNPQKRTVFEDGIYLDQSIPPAAIPMQYSNQAVFDHASHVLSEFHGRMNDLELYIDPTKPKPFFYTAAGSKHLIVALVFAIATSEPDKKFLFVEQAPFYSGHPNAVSDIFDYPNARFLAFHNPSEIVRQPDEVLIEIVTSPNNPDGKYREPVTDAKIIIADLVFASSAFGSDGTGYLHQNIEWIREARSSGKHVFSFNSASKQFGKTGARCGYLWYPIYDPYASLIFKKFFNFISFSTVAGGVSGLADFLNLIQAFLDLPDTGKALRKDAYDSLTKRHQLVEKELLNRYPGSDVVSIPGSPALFAKIKDPRIPEKRAADVILEDLDVSVNNGKPMGETDEFVRINLSGYSQFVEEFLNRLVRHNKYTLKDVLSVSTQTCHRILVSSAGKTNTLYIANPSDCIIDSDALKGPVEIVLPPFIDYITNHGITVKKIDKSNNPVVIKSENFTKELKKQGEDLQVQWSQPYYLNGQWHVVPVGEN